MTPLLLSILCSTAIVMLFTAFEKWKVDVPAAILVNYAVAAAVGLALVPARPSLPELAAFHWFPFSIVIGLMYIVMFYLLNLSLARAGVGPTAVASKISVLLPILLAVVGYGESLGALKLLGIGLALASLLLSARKGDQEAVAGFSPLPLVVFVGAGLTDALLLWVQKEHLPSAEAFVFSAFLFSVAGFFGLARLAWRRDEARWLARPANWLGGAALGLANFGSLYFMLEALAQARFESSVLFAINNIGVVLLATLLALALFGQRLTRVQALGVGLAAVALWVLQMA